MVACSAAPPIGANCKLTHHSPQNKNRDVPTLLSLLVEPRAIVAPPCIHQNNAREAERRAHHSATVHGESHTTDRLPLRRAGRNLHTRTSMLCVGAEGRGFQLVASGCNL